MAKALVFAFLMIWSLVGFADEEAPQALTLDGRLYSNPATKTPLLDTGKFKIQILDYNGTCVLYEEQQNFDTRGTGGAFNISIGEKASGTTKRTVSDSGNSLAAIFANNGTSVPGKLLSNGAACTGPGIPGTIRSVLITVIPTSDPTPREMTPFALNSVPSAIVADRAESLEGIKASGFLQVNNIAPTSLSQANLENVFSTTNYGKLTDLLSGGSVSYVHSGANGTIQAPAISGTPSGPTAGQIWYDAGVVKYWDGSSAQTLSAGSGVTSLTIGAGLTPTGTITTGGSTIAVDTGVTAGKIVAVQAGGKLPALDGSDLTNVKASSFSSTGSISTSGNVSATAANFGNLTLTNGATQTITLQPAASMTGSPLTFTLPDAMPASSGYVLSSTTGGVLSWVAQSSGGLAAVSNTASLANGKTWIGDAGGKAQEKFIGIADIRASVAGNAQFFPTTCTAGQTLTWQSGTDTMVCTNISLAASQITGTDTAFVLNGGQAGAVTAGPSDANALTLQTGGTARMTINSSGNVGVGTTTPVEALEVAGTTKSKAFNMLNVMTEKSFVVDFAGAADEKVQLYLPTGKRLQGTYEVAVATGYNSANCSGSISKIFSGYGRTNGTFTGKRIDVPYASDLTRNCFTISDPQWDATNLRWYFAIASLNGTTNTVHIHLKSLTSSSVQSRADQADISAPYTTDSTVYEKLSMNFAGNIGIGTTNPTDKLEVVGKIRATHICAPDGTNCKDLTTAWAGGGGTVTDITAGTGLTGGTINASGTIGLGTELAAINGLSTTGFVKRTGAGAYTTATAMDLTSDVTGTLPVASGGTNSSTTLTNNQLMVSSGGKIVEAGAMTDGQLVVGKTGAAPQLVTMSGDATVSNTGSITLKNTGTAGTYAKVTTDAQGRVTSGSALAASDIPSLDWAKITSGTPTTLSGYGIADAVANAGNTPSIKAGADASKGAATTTGQLYVATDASKIYRANGTTWDTIASNSGTGISALTGDVTASGSGSVAATVAKIQGIAVASTAPGAAGQVLKYDGSTQYAPSFIGVTDIRSTQSGNAQFFPTTCTAGQTLTWQSGTDTMVCTNISLAMSALTGSIDLTSQVTGTLPIANGGTGVTSLPGTFVLNGGQAGAVVVGTSDTNALSFKTSGTTQMTIASSGNIGMGATPSASKLHIASTYPLRLDLAASAEGPLRLRSFQDSFATEWGIGPVGSSLDFAVRYYDGTTWNERFRMTSGGNFGIGTVSPNDKLQVQGKIRATHICAVDGTNCKDLTTAWGGGSVDLTTGVAGVLPVANGGTGSATQNFVDLTTAQTVAGVKTWSNNAIFNGVIEAKGGILFNQGSAATNNMIFLGSTSPGAVDASMGFFAAGMGSNGADQGAYFLARGNSYSAAANQRGNIYFAAGNPSTPGAAEGSINFWTGQDLPRMIINKSGNVGIGTTTPADKLDVAGKIRATHICAPDGTNCKDLTTTWTGGSGTVTDITAGTGLTGGTINASGTIGLGTELAAINGLSTTGFVKRTGSGAYSTATSIALGSDVTGTLPIANGGTNSSTTLTNNQLMISSGGKIVEAGAMTDGQIVVGKTSSAPQLVTMSGDATIAATGAVTLKNTGTAGTYAQVTTDAQGRVTSGAATLPIANGGTGSTTKNFVDLTTAQTVAGVKTWSSNALFSGKVGIGTTSALAPLHVQGSMSLGGNWPGININIYNDGTDDRLIQNGSGFSIWRDSGSDNALRFDATTYGNAGTVANYTNSLNILQSGNVGIGTFAAGNAKLAVEGAIALDQLASNPAGVAGYGTIFVKTDGKLYYRDGTGTVKDLTASGGSVDLTSGVTGVLPVANGGTNSSTTLNNNRLMISSGSKIVEASAMTDGQIVVGKTGSAPQLVAMGGDATVSNTGSVTLKNTGTSGTYTKVTTDAQGRVTSGTSYVAVTDIKSTQAGNAQFFPTTCTAGQTLTWQSGTDTMVCTNISLPASQITGTAAAFVLNGGQAGAVTAGTTDATALTLKTDNTARMIIDSSGNIGIGTSTPLSALHMASSGVARMTVSSSDETGTVGTLSYITKFTDTAETIGSANPTGNNKGWQMAAVGNGHASNANKMIWNYWTGSGWIYSLVMDPAGNVGIGTTSPGTALHVYGNTTGASLMKSENVNTGTAAKAGFQAVNDAGNNLLFVMNSSTFSGTGNAVASGGTIAASGNGGLSIGASNGSGSLKFFAGGTTATEERMRIGSDGYVGIGTTTPGYRLELPNVATNDGRGRANQWAVYSDGRFKTEVTRIPAALSKVMELEGITYRSNQSGELGEREMGFIAQSVERVVPEVVSISKTTIQRKDGTSFVVDDYRSLDYARISALLVEAVKELYQKMLDRFDQQDSRIISLEQENAQLKKESVEMKTYLCSKDPNAPFCR